MSIEEQENYVDKDALRAELKVWESTFQKANGGRKPGRADIKKDATIQSKYKLYDVLARRSKPLPPPNTTPKKSRRLVEPLKDTGKGTVAGTPRKTPSKATSLAPPSHTLSPVQEIKATPAFIRNALGPTPQKDGHVLGIFDIISTGTPHKEDNLAASSMDAVIAATPSKAATTSSNPNFSKTPQSSSKRFFLDAFAGTPLKRKRDNDDIGTGSSSKRKFATPAFLRRSHPLAPIDEEDAAPTCAQPPFRKRGLVRSLSSIIQNLKKNQEKDMDDDWDIMNEIEAEERGEKTDKPVSKILVEDSQVQEMPLGPDQAQQSEESGAENVETGRKPWKKKGLKRQTRRVIMRPVLHQVRKEGDLEDNDSNGEEDVVQETQLQDVAEEIEDEGEGEGSDHDQGKAKTSKNTSKRKSKPTARTAADTEGDTSKKKARKVNPDAHANFRKLKIKNKNSKANGRGGRFGRR